MSKNAKSVTTFKIRIRYRIRVWRRARIEDEKRFPWAAQGMMPPTILKSVADFRTTKEEQFRYQKSSWFLGEIDCPKVVETYKNLVVKSSNHLLIFKCLESFKISRKHTLLSIVPIIKVRHILILFWILKLMLNFWTIQILRNADGVGGWLEKHYYSKLKYCKSLVKC